MTALTPELTHDCDLSLFVACYNEEEGIIPTLDTVVAAAREVGITYDVVIIDDCSTDRSVAPRSSAAGSPATPRRSFRTRPRSAAPPTRSPAPGTARP